jgi:arginine:ornithine antiporter / lysine permease
LYVIARRENAQRMFRQFELALCVLIIIGAVIGVVLLATGAIAI